eukprot:gnl/Dysnectes_brevis/2933_a3602_1058.p2 GENE.gnl/Dysnectes_brevis/2933_a3602_1058~~gnl/Dysnectes_brevis/2933_a3602_1058.p2  ORF type:complete len:476 (+),score=108.93 gnl/Dysnectes_brevis/2933_a3602_1058:1857-3284(+)
MDPYTLSRSGVERKSLLNLPKFSLIDVDSLIRCLRKDCTSYSNKQAIEVLISNILSGWPPNPKWNVLLRSNQFFKQHLLPSRVFDSYQLFCSNSTLIRLLGEQLTNHFLVPGFCRMVRHVLPHISFSLSPIILNIERIQQLIQAYADGHITAVDVASYFRLLAGDDSVPSYITQVDLINSTLIDDEESALPLWLRGYIERMLYSALLRTVVAGGDQNAELIHRIYQHVAASLPKILSAEVLRGDLATTGMDTWPDRPSEEALEAVYVTRALIVIANNSSYIMGGGRFVRTAAIGSTGDPMSAVLEGRGLEFMRAAWFHQRLFTRYAAQIDSTEAALALSSYCGDGSMSSRQLICFSVLPEWPRVHAQMVLSDAQLDALLAQEDIDPLPANREALAAVIRVDVEDVLPWVERLQGECGGDVELLDLPPFALSQLKLMAQFLPLLSSGSGARGDRTAFLLELHQRSREDEEGSEVDL